MSASTDPTWSAGGPGRYVDARPGVDTRYRAAMRHSRFVRILKIALPTVSVLVAGAFFVFTYFVPSLPEGVSFGSIDVTNNAVVMENPHVSGFTNNGRAYELKADRAEQSLKDTKVVTLQKIGATIGMDDAGGTAKVVATTGTYYADKQRLYLDKAITLSTSTGIAGTLQNADIDMKAGTMRSDQPIDFTAQGSRIQANSVEVQDRGKRVLFRNGVKVTYSAPADSPSPQPAAPSVIE
ncbi:LPS export ABC transporter periplasmic protein LptC [Kaistia defluvii]|uniref:LPS export ABC transporter periplasmic protein LptC n=1 Tax=Kaistia defluvii TaxID=410841 RepID=UPI00225C0429|nr:LPS export ABC transporter periplasmic protein LptC [Kaistia defluvii]MCX5520548.1 LPS export ABC transporter periplasmic protein LptC [Kaistia defluvii]